MGIKFTNNAETRLATGISPSDTTLAVTPGDGDNFPAVTGGGSDWFIITLEDSSGNIELIRVNHRPAASDTMGSGGYPLQRGYGGTTARSWVAGDVVDLRFNAESVAEMTKASNISFTPTGGVAATTVQGAIAEVDAEKLAIATYQSHFPGLSLQFEAIKAVVSTLYDVLTTDIYRTLRYTGGVPGTFRTTAAASTYGSGFTLYIIASGESVTFDPNGAETVNGVASVTIPVGYYGKLMCDGANWALGIMPSTAATANPFVDTTPVVQGSVDATKKLRFEVDGLTTGTTRVVTMPDQDVMLRHVPAGCIMDYAGATIPPGWLECDGSSVSRTTYAALFAAIGTTWGSVDANSFNLPDFRARTRIGAGQVSTVETFTSAEISTSTEEITVAANTLKWITGMQVTFSVVVGSAPTTSTAGQLDDGDTAYVIRVSSTKIKLASSRANADAGTAINITNAGSGTFRITYSGDTFTLGEAGGEQSHALRESELASHTHIQNSHTHTIPTPSIGGAVTTASTSINQTPGATITSNAATATNQNTGGDAPHNNMQPFAVVRAIIAY